MDNKLVRVNANIFFEVPADYEVTGREFLKMPPVGVGLITAQPDMTEMRTVVETAKEAETIEVIEVENDA